ncbi:MAG: DUF1295 domain-containing protein [Nannocystaceae bacterium]
MTAELFAHNAALVFGLMFALWLVSVRLRDASIVDPWWSICFLLVTANTAIQTGLSPGKTLVLAAVAVWAQRLWLHLLLRSRGKPEDPRYARFRRRYGPARYWWVSLFQVFLLQGTLALVISTPLALSAAAAPPDPITAFDLVGLAVFVVGFAFEAIADHQLQRFRDDPQRGEVLDTGLWRLSRHPNYFGEAALWWGLWLCALDQPGGWSTGFAPALMTFLLLRVSGVTMLDAHMTATRPSYREYARRTSAFWPRRPRA